MVRLNIVNRILQLNNYDKRKLKKDKDSLVIGKDDKSISVLSNGEYIDIKELPIFTRPTNSSGVIKFPTQDGNGFVIQYGTGSIPVNSEGIVNFIEPYNVRSFQVLIIPRGADMLDSSYTLKSTNLSNFVLQTKGGSYANFTFYWYAIGF